MHKLRRKAKKRNKFLHAVPFATWLLLSIHHSVGENTKQFCEHKNGIKHHLIKHIYAEE